MPMMKISRQGLSTIAVLTALLWGCLFVEKFTVAHARMDGYRALDEIRALQLKKHMIPVSTPAMPRGQATSAVG
jgi:hypothetical protein